jgi:hypothetical protein
MYLQTTHRRRVIPDSYHTSVRDKIAETKTNLTESAWDQREPMVRLIQRHRIGFEPDEPDAIAKETDRIDHLVEGAHHTLLSASSVFPFVLFPDSLHIDRQKLTIIHRYFIGSSRTISVPLHDILNVEANVGPLFGSLILTSKYFKNNTHSITFLHRKDTIQAQLLLQGYMVAHREKISLAHIGTAELSGLLTNLGQSSLSFKRG